MYRGKLKREEEESIRNNFIYLKEQVEAKDIIDFLFQHGVISRNDKEKISSGITQIERMDILLDIILHAGPRNAYILFLTSLEEKYPHVYEKLKQSELKVPQKWTQCEILGTGKFGNIYLCTESDSGLMFALKQVKIGSDKATKKRQQTTENELNILKNLRHTRILQYYGSRREKNVLSIFLEYMPGGSILDYIEKSGKMTEKATAKVTIQVLEALVFLHSNGIVHQNIKAANVLRGTHGEIKLGDFGISKYLTNISSSDGPSKPVEEIAFWSAPEVVRGEDYDGSADIWSVGCTVVEMLTLKPPFHEYGPLIAIHKIGANQPPKYKLPDKASDDVKKFLIETSQHNTSNRPPAKKLLEHAFVKK